MSKCRNRIASLALRAAVLFVIFLLAGCGARRFELTDRKYLVKPDTLVVFSGTKNKLDTLLAESITQELRRRSTFSVMSQKDVAKGLPGYPYLFIQPAESDSPTENRPSKFLVDMAQGKLKTTYVFIVWIDALDKLTKTIYNIVPVKMIYTAHVAGTVFEYPKGTIIGTAQFDVEDSRHFSDGSDEAQVIEKMMETAGKQMVDSFLEVTHTQRSDTRSAKRD